MPRPAESDPARVFACQRCTAGALAIVLIGAFFGLAGADWSERRTAALHAHDAAVARVVAAVQGTFDQDTRLLDLLVEHAGAGDSPAAQNFLNLAPALVPGVQAAVVLDRAGAVSAKIPDAPTGRALDTIAGEARAAFAMPSPPALYVSRPTHDADRGLDLIGLARPVDEGLAIVAIDAATLAPPQTLPHGALTIRRDDGAVLFRDGPFRSGDANASTEAAAVPATPLEVSYGRPAGAMWREWRAVWLRNGAVVGLVGLIAALVAALFDRRRRRAAVHNAETQAREAVALRRNNADLAAAAKNADEASRAKSRFFAQVTHELRTPLNAIIGFSETIRAEMFGPVANPRYLEYAALIHDAGGHLLSLINDLLDVSKLEEGKMEIAPIRVSAAALARSTLDLVELLARDGRVALTTSGIDTCSDLNVDPRAAKQVLVNLLSNAIKFTPPGGRIDMSFAGRSDGAVVITVADSGIGMSSDEIARAFEPFGRASGEYAAAAPGTGLGLPIARALVRLHGGELSLTSAPGRGTTVTVVFPLDANAPHAAEAVTPARAA